MSELEIEFLGYLKEEIDEGWYGLGNGSYGLGVAETVLPERGRYEGANYRVALTLTDAERGIETHNGSTTTTMELCAKLSDTTLDFLADGDMKAYIPTYAFEETDNHPAVSWDPSDCYVTLELCYDSGMSCTPWRLDREPLPDPEIDYTTELSEDMQIDYRGRVTGTTSELRFPNAINCCLPFDEVVLVALEPDSEGVDDPTFEYEEGRNLLAIDSKVDIVWIAEPIIENGTTGYYYTVWRVDNSLFANPHRLGISGRATVKLDPETGDILDTDF